jgi:hypothetical protein
VDGYVEWNHPAIGPDGGIYAGSSVNRNTDEIRTPTYDEGFIPEGSTPLFYALKGPTTPVRAELPDDAPAPFRIASVFPNPFASRMTVTIEADEPGKLVLDVVDMLGRTVTKVDEGSVSPARRVLSLSSSNGAISAGVYILRARWVGAASGREVVATRNVARVSR